MAIRSVLWDVSSTAIRCLVFGAVAIVRFVIDFCAGNGRWVSCFVVSSNQVRVDNGACYWQKPTNCRLGKKCWKEYELSFNSY